MHHTSNATPIPLFNDDEWRGTTDPSVRRRVQNRLNQRAYRLRRRQTQGIQDKRPKRPSRDTIKTASIPYSPTARFFVQSDPDGSGSVRAGEDVLDGEGHTGDKSHFNYAPLQVCQRDFDSKHGAASGTRIDLAPWYTNPTAVFMQFQKLKLGRHIGCSPSNDHLLCIMQFNVMRAFGTISTIIGLSTANLTDDNSSSPFFDYATTSSHRRFADTIPPACLPKSLIPTDLQISTPHHPWFDILPFPQMRDNLLRLESDTNAAVDDPNYDADNFCHWMVGMDAHQKEAGLIVWGEPWDLASWEVTADFYRKWSWTLEGCVELFKSTNYWRARRGEKPLFAIENL